jgi:hydrogenase expression/formation protein HypD
MKYLDEYRDARIARALAAEIRRRCSRRWVLMEICGGQTHTLMRYGIDELLGDSVELVHGPGCPVCVTPLEMIDRAINLARRPEVTLVSYGDMLCVPGSKTDLFQVKAEGGDVRIVYSPTDAVNLARTVPDRKVVFFAIGFETTAPAHAMAVLQAERLGLKNFSFAGFPRARASCNSRFAQQSQKSRSGFCRARPCLHDCGLPRLRRTRSRISRVHRGWWIRAGRSFGSHSHAGHPT